MRLLALLALMFVPLTGLAQTAASADDTDARAAPDARAEATAAPAESALPEPGQAPVLDLKRLLTPRSSLPARPAPARPGGKDRETWEREFAEQRAEVARLESTVDAKKKQLRESSGGDWGYSPAGGALPTDPEVQRLRAQLKRDRRSLETAERRLRDLQVEASLAGVPDPWKDPQR